MMAHGTIHMMVFGLLLWVPQVGRSSPEHIAGSNFSIGEQKSSYVRIPEDSSKMNVSQQQGGNRATTRPPLWLPIPDQSRQDRNWQLGNQHLNQPEIFDPARAPSGTVSPDQTGNTNPGQPKPF